MDEICESSYEYLAIIRDPHSELTHVPMIDTARGPRQVRHQAHIQDIPPEKHFRPVITFGCPPLLTTHYLRLPARFQPLLESSAYQELIRDSR